MQNKPELNPLTEVVDQLMPRFKGMENIFMKMGVEQFLAFCQSQLSGGIAMQIRNEFGLWTKDSKIYHYLAASNPGADADRLSAIILGACYNRLIAHLQPHPDFAEIIVPILNGHHRIAAAKETGTTITITDAEGQKVSGKVKKIIGSQVILKLSQ